MTKKNRPAGMLAILRQLLIWAGKHCLLISLKVSILTVDGYAFKDLNKNGKLDPYEDGACLPGKSKDLAQRMSIEQLPG